MQSTPQVQRDLAFQRISQRSFELMAQAVDFIGILIFWNRIQRLRAIPEYSESAVPIKFFTKLSTATCWSSREPSKNHDGGIA